jgi:ribonuclease T2
MISKRLMEGIALFALLTVAAVLFIREQPAPPGQDPAAASASKGGEGSASAFDYYLVALSWSPTWCESHPDDNEQCARRGYGFILHGLWPQYEDGMGPRDCAIRQRPDRATIERTLAFMPSRGLIEHEWQTHGTCSGLDPGQYFALADRAYAAIRIPPELTAGSAAVAMNAEDIRAAFLRADPRLRENMLAVTCHSGRLAEVRVCVDDALEPRTCGRGVRMRCPRDVPLRIPAVR